MNTRKLLLTSLLAAAAMSVPAYADTPVITWGLNNTTTNVYKWNGTADRAEPSDYDTVSNWLKGDTNTTWSDISSITNFATSTSKPARPENKGVVLYFDGNGRTLDFSDKGLTTSDGGGAWVAGTNNTVTVGIGTWAGSIRVDATNTLNTSWTQLKEGNIFAEGIVNGDGDLQFNGGSALRTWYTGENGQINMLTATEVSNGSISATGSGTVTFSTLTRIAAGSYVEAAGATVNFNSKTVSGAGSIKLSSGTIQNLTVGSGMTLAVTGSGLLSNVTFSAGSNLNLDAGSSLELSGNVTLGGTATLFSAIQNSGTVTVSTETVFNLTKTGETTLISGGTIDGWNSISRSSFTYFGAGLDTMRSAVVNFSAAGVATLSYAAENLTWAGTSENSTWNTSNANANWTNNGTSGAFYNGDNVTFGSLALNKTVTLENGTNLAVGTMTVASGDYKLTLASGTASLKGMKLTVASGASLQVGDVANVDTPKIDLGFSDISLAGTLKFKNGGASTWSSLTFEEGGKLYFLDGKGSTDNLTISQMTVNGAATITSASDKGLAISNLSGAGALSVVGNDGSVWGFSNKFRVKIASLLNYTGTATFTNGNHGLAVSFIDDSTLDSAAKLVFGTGVTVENTGNLTLAGTVELSNNAITNTNGTISVDAASVNFVFDPSTLAVTSTDSETGARTYTLISGGKITNWSSLTADNFDRTYFVGRETASVGTVDGQVVVSGYIANLVWAGTTAEGGNLWNTSTTNKPWTNGGTADAFYARDNVTFDGAAANKTVSIGGDLTVGTITVSADGYTFSATDDATITSGAIAVSATNGLTLEAAQDKTLTITNALKNGDGKVESITKTGAGTVALSNSGNQIKSVTVSQGTLKLSGAGGTNVAGFESITIASGATLTITGGNDLAKWSDVTYNIAGTLNMGTCRFSISGGSFTLGSAEGTGTALISGTGEGNRALDFYGNTTVDVVGNAEISAATLVRNMNAATPTIATFNVNSGKTLTFSGELKYYNDWANYGTGVLKKTGTGNLVFSGSSAVGSSLTVSEGALEITSSTAGSFGANLTIENGATASISGNEILKYNGFSENQTITVTVGGELDLRDQRQTIASNTSLVLTGGTVKGTNTEFGSLDFSSANTIAATSGNSVIDANIRLRDTNHGGSGDLTFNVSGNATLVLNGVINPSTQYETHNGRNIIKIGDGELSLGGANTNFKGNITVSAGSLVVRHANALGDSTGTTTVAANASLAIASGVTITNAGTISLSENAKLVVDLSGKASATETFTLDLVSGTALSYNGYSITSTNAGILLGALELDGWNQSGWTQSLAYIDGSNTLRLTMTIPEPSMFGLLAGLGALALAGTRRRRRKA